MGSGSSTGQRHFFCSLLRSWGVRWILWAPLPLVLDIHKTPQPSSRSPAHDNQQSSHESATRRGGFVVYCGFLRTLKEHQRWPKVSAHKAVNTKSHDCSRQLIFPQRPATTPGHVSAKTAPTPHQRHVTRDHRTREVAVSKDVHSDASVLPNHSMPNPCSAKAKFL